MERCMDTALNAFRAIIILADVKAKEEIVIGK